MPEEERLELVSAVEDEFTEPLERFENALEDVDDEIRQTGGGEDKVIVDVEVRGIEQAVTELEALDAALEDVDDRLGDMDDIDFSGADTAGPVPDGDAGRGVATSGGFRERFETTQEAVTGVDADVRGAQRLAGIRRADDVIGDRGSGIFRRTRELEFELDDLRLTMGNLHSTVAALVPLVLVFAGALPAVITAVGALGAAAIAAAGALGAIGALGLAGMSLQQQGEIAMEPIANRLSEAADAFVDAFAPLAESMAPVIRRAISDLEAMAGPLATASAGLLELRGAFQNAVSVFAGGLPDFIEGMITFVHATMPLLSSFISFLADVDFLGFFAAHLEAALPALIVMGKAFADMIPAIVQVSQGLLVVAAAVASVFRGFAILIDQVPFLGEVLGILTGAFLAASAAVGLHNILLEGATGAVLSYTKAVLVDALSAIQSWIAANLGLNATLTQTAILVGIITAGLAILAGVAATKAASGMELFGNNVATARKELEKLSKTQNGLPGDDISVGVGGGGANRSSSVYTDNSTTVINAGNRDDAARQQYANEYERQQHVDSVFGG